jgi:predicted nucleic acid-binding protein
VVVHQTPHVTVAPFRCLLDTMILDKIAADDRMLNQVQRLTDESKLELVVTSVTERQVAPITEEPKRRYIAAVPRTVIGTAGFILDHSQLGVDRLGPDEPIEAIRKGRPKETPDALIAATAEWDGLTLVTEDARLRRALERRGTPVCGWEQLRRDIELLAGDSSA